VGIQLGTEGAGLRGKAPAGVVGGGGGGCSGTVKKRAYLQRRDLASEDKPRANMKGRVLIQTARSTNYMAREDEVTRGFGHLAD